ncbi:lysophospholipid acyltransferase family protein [Stackebrandtia nassauensis]|uniref:lysophospholipid acyltransferase family protein n=1 Tax=Stackebrandtia nassauensis TaxID=283811 RepID=UPI001B7FE6FE|nr:lysophospholipid acyltransferase family protein [Stackebrandtia nassauensis]
MDEPGRRAAWPRRLLRWGAVAAVLAAGILVPRPRLARALLRAAGVRVVVRGKAPRTGLVVGNHVSWLDVVVFVGWFGCRMLAKTEVRRWPVIGVAARRLRVLFIDRDSLRRLPETVDSVAEALRDGDLIGAFPEGTTWCGRAMGRFRPAVFQAAADSGAPVTPVALEFTVDGRRSSVAAFVGQDTVVASLSRVIAARGVRVEAQLLPPRTGSDRRVLASAAHEDVSRARGYGVGHVVVRAP